MQSDASGARAQAAVLAARDARQALLERHLGGGRRPAPWALVAAALNLPGGEKAPPGAEALLGWALFRVAAAVPGVEVLHRGADALGPSALLAAPGPAGAAKAACLAVEAAHPAARLVDLDVYLPGPGGAPAALDRAALGLPPRACLLCDAPARECIRLGRHPPAAVAARARALLAEVPA